MERNKRRAAKNICTCCLCHDGVSLPALKRFLRRTCVFFCIFVGCSSLPQSCASGCGLVSNALHFRRLKPNARKRKLKVQYFNRAKKSSERKKEISRFMRVLLTTLVEAFVHTENGWPHNRKHPRSPIHPMRLLFLTLSMASYWSAVLAAASRGDGVTPSSIWGG